MQLIDTHCHIHQVDFPLPIKEVEENAKNNDVTGMICVGTDIEDSLQAISFSKTRSNCWASIAIHPHEAKSGTEAVNKLEEIVKRERQNIVAIGECGLDYYYEYSSKSDQRKMLTSQIELALEHDLPIIFHVRDAFHDFWPILNDYKKIRGVLHSFTGAREDLDKGLNHNLMIGLNGIVTFTKDSQQTGMFKELPLENMLLETDAPFLTPAPFRGRINEPANVLQIAKYISNLRNISLEDIADITTKNAKQLFSV